MAKKKRDHKSNKFNSGPVDPELLKFITGARGLQSTPLPEGFRSVRPTQAMMEYLSPILAQTEDMNGALQLGSKLWNRFMSLRPESKSDPTEGELIDEIAELLDKDLEASAETLQEMKQRVQYLFPKDIQPDNPMTIYMRKETRRIIPDFNWDSIRITDKEVPMGDTDKEFVQALQRLDRYILEGADYDDWEDQYFHCEETCEQRFGEWLKQKELIRNEEDDFAWCTSTYLNFIYRYGHPSPVVLRSVRIENLEQFFMHHLVRKTILEPHEYVKYLPAIVLIHVFLDEKGYSVNGDKVIDSVERIERPFMQMLRNEFS